MKKRLLILLAVLAVAVSVLAITANAAEETCTYCGKSAAEWEAISANGHDLIDGHYYLTGDGIVLGSNSIASGKTVCLDLCGYQVIGNKNITINDGGTMHVWNGNFLTRGVADNPTPGGAFGVDAGGSLSLTDVNFIWDTKNGRDVPRGGFLHINGDVTMKNTTLTDGVVVAVTSTEGIGGNVFVSATGSLTMDGGCITGGTAKTGPCVYARGSVTLAGDASIEQLYIVPKDNNGPAMDKILNIESSYTGTASLILHNVTAENTYVGHTADGADLSGLTLVGSDLLLQADGSGNLITYLPDPVVILSSNGETASKHNTLGAALEEVGDGQTIKLQRCLTETVTIGKNVTLDLNGHDLTGVEVNEDCTLYVMDSKTDDYTVNDGVYGKIGSISGNVEGFGTVKGAIDEDEHWQYLPHTEDDNSTSFHKLHMQLYETTLRPGKVALYFNSIFKGDEVVKGMISTFGVSMSLDRDELENGTLKPGTYTAIPSSEFNGSSETTSSLLTNIMRTDHGNITNRRNAATTVYGRPYIKLDDDTILWGVIGHKSLQETVKEIDKQIANGENFLNKTQERALLDMYYKFKKVMSKWSIPEVKAAYEAHEKDTLKILTIGNSHSNDSNWLLREVFLRQKPEQDVVVGIMYYSGCSVEKHVYFAQNNSPEYSYHKNETGEWETTKEATLRTGLEDEHWDIVILQEMNVALGKDSTFENDNIQVLMDYVNAHTTSDPDFGFNMVWANPVTPTYLDADTRMTHSMEDGKSLDDWIYTYDTVFGRDQQLMFQRMLKNTQEHIVDPGIFEYIIPSGTAVQYANDQLGMTDLDLYRDYTHLSDISRLMVSYLWYAKLNKLTELSSIDVNVIPAELRHSRFDDLGALTITDEMKDFMLNAINYALDHQFEDVAAPTEQEDPTADDTLNVLMIGNSFSYYFIDELKAMADAAEKKLEVYNVYYSGCTLHDHYKHLLDGKQVYSLRNGTNELKANQSLWACINYESINWDIISLQEGSSVVRSADLTDANVTELYNTNVKYFSHLYEFVREKFPKSRIAFHQTWAYQVGTTSTGFNTADADAQAAHHNRIQAYTQKFVERYKNTPLPLDLVNTGDAWAIVRENGYDNLCARLGEGTDHEGDYYHDGDIGGGQYLNACVWYEYLFEETCVGNNFVPSYTYDGQSFDNLFDQTKLQNAAHQATPNRNAE